jgi:single-strand DNA-binding protein
MAKTVNRVELIGNIGSIEVSNITGGGKYCTLSVATQYRYKTTTGEVKEETTWTRVSVYGKVAEHCETYLRKGSKVRVIGRLRNSSYTKDNVVKYSTDVVCEDIMFLNTPAENKEPEKQQASTTTEAKNQNEEDDMPF